MKYWKATNKVPKRQKGGLKLPKGIVLIRTSQDVRSERHITAYNGNWSVRPLLIPKRGA